MMNSVEVEPQISNIGQQSAGIIGLSIRTGFDLMMGEVVYLLIALSPLPASPMPQEGQFEEGKGTTDMHEQEQPPSTLPIS